MSAEGFQVAPVAVTVNVGDVVKLRPLAQPQPVFFDGKSHTLIFCILVRIIERSPAGECVGESPEDGGSSPPPRWAFSERHVFEVLRLDPFVLQPEVPGDPAA